jgi:hypothetical protein
MSEASRFLEWLRPGGPWVLTAIPNDVPGAPTATFVSLEECDDFIRRHQDKGVNVYYTLNPVMRPLERKPARADIRDVAFFHVDVDPRAGVDLDQERTRILRSLTEQLPPDVPQPSAIIDSGGGYQGLWRLAKPLPINGEEQKYEDAKRFNQHLEALFLGGDACHNVDRILRIPGTTNFPNAKKQKKGRVAVQAKIVYLGDEVYPVNRFTPAPLVQEVGVSAFAGGVSRVEISGNVRRLNNLDELPAGVSPLCKLVISHGYDPACPERWEDRSRTLWWVCCELVRQGCDDDTIYSVITDREWRVSESVLERGRRAHQYAVSQISRARDEVVAPELRELNDKFAVVLVGGKCRVMTENEDELGEEVRRTRLDLLTFQDFNGFYRNRRIQEVDARGRVKTMSLAEWWLAHPCRRQYEDIVFAPGVDTPNKFNLWRGFAFQPRAGTDKCQLYLEHMKRNICRGVEEHYEYLLRWMARCVQKPAEPGQVAVVLRGKQGTGKNRFADLFGGLFGRHFLAIQDAQHVFGQFLSHLRDCCVLLSNEAFWAGNKTHEGKLKALITEPTIMTEGKGSNAVVGRNCLHLILASNEDWVVPVASEDRRFFVLDVGKENMKDAKFFGALSKDMRDGGSEQLLGYLLGMDLGKWNVRDIPQTDALRDQKIRSQDGPSAWWYQRLHEGSLFETMPGWPKIASISDVQCDFNDWQARAPGKFRQNVNIGIFLSEATKGAIERRQLNSPMVVRVPTGEVREVPRPRVYIMPTLDECRSLWDSVAGGPFRWPDDDQILELSEEDRQAQVF